MVSNRMISHCICCILKIDKVARGIPESCKQEIPKVANRNSRKLQEIIATIFTSAKPVSLL